MSWLKFMTTLLKAKEMKDNYDTIKTPYDYIKKVSSKNRKTLTADDLKYFKTDTMQAAIKDIRLIVAKSRKAESAKLVWPTCDSEKAFANWFAMTKNNGSESFKAVKAREQYRAVLVKFDKDLKVMLTNIVSLLPPIDMNIRLTKAMTNYAAALQKGFMSLAEFPLGGSDSKILFFTLSQETQEYRSLVNSLNGSMINHKKIAGKNIKDCQEMIKKNNEWLKGVGGNLFKTEASLKKNMKADRPKK